MRVGTPRSYSESEADSANPSVRSTAASERLPHPASSFSSPMSAQTYYPPQAYNNYNQQYQGYAQHSAQYPPQYQQAAPGQGQPSPYPYTPNLNSPIVKTPGSPPPEPISAPDLAEVTDAVASKALQRLISSELRHAGFDSASHDALRRLEQETVACPSSLQLCERTDDAKQVQL